MSHPVKQSANDTLAFLIVECNVPLPYDVALNLTENDPLFKALFRAWENKRRREKENNAFLASCFYNAMGAKTKPSDFLPPTPKTREEQEVEIKNNILLFNLRHGVSPR